MHNNIMAAGSRDRPPMLATGRYAQWRSRFLRYIDTRPNGDALRKCILEVPEQTTVETVMNMTPENRAHFESEKEAIHLILTGIGDEIYSTVDACHTAHEEGRPSKGYNNVNHSRYKKSKDKLFGKQFGTVASMQVNVQFLQQLQPEWSRFVIIVKQQHNTFATAQTLQDPYYQTSKPHKSYAPTSKASLPTRSHATTRYKGKEIAKPITPPSESASEEDSDPEQAQKDKDMQKNLALIAKTGILETEGMNDVGASETVVRKVSTSKHSNLTASRRDEYIDNNSWKHITATCQRSRRFLMSDSGTDSVAIGTVETGDSNVTPDSPDMCDNDIQDDQNDVECDDERVALANLIEHSHSLVS
ncbi:hypothetical protein Tco_0892898 [Tanacetum coccineum]|uniref:Uncharacterized protein n=1 Tax=Tanacetum coccineum TaxID=301880 RepID=A0ABQ5C7G3_9ASTR